MSNTYYQRLTIFDNVDVPIDGAGTTTCSTDPAHSRPYLLLVQDGSEASVNFIEGRTTIGQVNVKLIDKRTVPTDQTTGWFTGILASNGESRLAGRRALVEQADTSGVYYTLFNGVIGNVSLDPDKVTYTLPLRDVRERERGQRLFLSSGETMSVIPYGPVNGYGTVAKAGGGTTQLVPPVGVRTGTFKFDPSGLGGSAATRQGVVFFDQTAPLKNMSPQDFINKFSMFQGIAPGFDSSGNPLGECLAYVTVRWRPVGGPTWTTMRNMPAHYINSGGQQQQVVPGAPFSITSQQVNGADMYTINGVVLGSRTGTDLPTAGQHIEIQLLSSGPCTSRYPLVVECSAGQLTKDVYDGKYTDVPTNVKYDATAMAAFVANTPTFRLLQEKSVDDMRQWLEDNVYKPLGYAPCLDAAGNVVPVSAALPDPSYNPITLDNTNCVDANWEHNTEDGVTRTDFKWVIDALNTSTGGNSTLAPMERLITFNQEAIYLDGAAAYIGIQEIVYEPSGVRDIANSTSYNAAITSTGQTLALSTSHAMIDRFRFGGQRITVTGARRSDANVQAAKLGDWVIAGFSALPDYTTGKRGISRLAQIISIKNTSGLTRDFVLLDAGPNGTPYSTPTLSSVTVSNNVISVTGTPGTGGTLEIQYAVSATSPATTSPLWQTFARGAAGTYTTTPLVPGNTVWVRARTAGGGKRPSAYTVPTSVAVGSVPLPVDFGLNFSTTAAPVVTVTPNQYMVAMRVYYAIQDADTQPPASFTTFVDTNATTVTLPVTVPTGKEIVVQIIGYTAWTGSAVSGTAGPSFTMQADYVAGVTSTQHLPIATVVPSEDYTANGGIGVGNLTVNITGDLDARVTGVRFTTTPGRGASTVTTVAAGPFTSTVNLVDKASSIIFYEVLWTDFLGNTGQVLDSDTIRYSVGTTPVQPDIRPSIAANGVVSAVIVGDSDAYQHKVFAQLGAAPDFDTINASGSLTPASSRIAAVNNLITLNMGQTAYIGAYSINARGVTSVPTVIPVVFNTTTNSPRPIVTVGTPTVQSDKVLYPITIDAQMQELFIYMKQVDGAHDPGQAINVESLVSKPFREYVSGENGAITVQPGVQFTIALPMLSTSMIQLVTMVAYDINSQRSLPVNIRAVGLGGSAPTPGTAPTAVFSSLDSVSVTNNVTVSGAPSTIRVYVNNSAPYDVTYTGASGGTVAVKTSGLTPATPYQFQYSEVLSGVESTKSAIITKTTAAAATGTGGTGTNGKVPTPSIGPSTWSQTYQAAVLKVLPGSNTPNGVTWHAEVATVSGGTYFEDTSAASQYVPLKSAFDQGGTAVTKYYRVWGTCPGYTDSDRSAERSVTMPGGYYS